MEGYKTDILPKIIQGYVANSEIHIKLLERARKLGMHVIQVDSTERGQTTPEQYAARDKCMFNGIKSYQDANPATGNVILYCGGNHTQPIVTLAEQDYDAKQAVILSDFTLAGNGSSKGDKVLSEDVRKKLNITTSIPEALFLDRSPSKPEEFVYDARPVFAKLNLPAPAIEAGSHAAAARSSSPPSRT